MWFRHSRGDQRPGFHVTISHSSEPPYERLHQRLRQACRKIRNLEGFRSTLHPPPIQDGRVSRDASRLHIYAAVGTDSLRDSRTLLLPRSCDRDTRTRTEIGRRSLSFVASRNWGTERENEVSRVLQPF